jgi:hypothetical protein
MKSVSPSFHSFDWRSNVRGVDATVKFATAAPDGVNLNSGHPVRLPTMVTTGSPAIIPPCSSVLPTPTSVSAGWCGRSHEW